MSRQLYESRLWAHDLVQQNDIFAIKPDGNGNHRLADAGTEDAMAVAHGKPRPMGSAEDMRSLIVNTPLR